MSTITGTVITHGVTLSASGTYTSPLTITSTAEIKAVTPHGNAIYGPATAAWTISNQGTILGYGSVGNGIDLQLGGSVGDAGLIAGYSGVYISGADGSVSNSGTISGTNGNGVDLLASGYVTNTGTGLIRGSNSGVYITGTAGTVVNSATINGAGNGVDLHYGGIVANNGGLIEGAYGVRSDDAAAMVTNSGTIATTGFGTSVLLDEGGSVGNTGLISGGRSGIEIDVNAGMVTNSGTIIGQDFEGIDLRDGGSVGNTGVVAGDSYGVYIESAAGAVTNAGTITGTDSSGVGLEDGGSVANTAGTASIRSSYADGVLIDGTGTVTNSGTIAATDTGSNIFGVDIVEGGSVGNTGLIRGYTGIDITDAYGMVTNSGRITATGTSSVTFGVELRAGGSVGNTGTGLIQGYTGVYITGSAATVANSGMILGSAGNGVSLSQGGYVGNTGTGLIQGYAGVYIGGSGTVINSGTIVGTGTSFSSRADGIRIFGVGGTIVNSGIILSGSSTYSVYVEGGGSLTNNQSGYIGSGGIKFFGASTIVNDGRIVDADGNGVYILGGAGTVINSGTIVGAQVFYGVSLAAGGTVSDSGTISGANGAISFGGTGANLLVLESGYQLGGGVDGAGSASNTVELAGSAGGPLTVAYDGLGLSQFQDVLFGAGGHDTLKVTNTGGTLPVTISGFTLTSDIVDLTAIGTDGTIASQSATEVTVTGSLGSESLQLDASDAARFTVMSDGATGTDLVACFCRGTRILTDKGDVAVEDLAIRDKVVTLSGAVRPIKWIGRRAYDGRFVAANRAVLPIRVAAGALGDGLPARELWLSPEHALYIDDVLVPAGLLTNGATIRQEESVERVDYFHIEVAEHDVILAEGAPAESFVDCDNRFMFQNGTEFAALYPDDVPVPWDFCAPRVEPDSPELAMIRAALLARAEALGYGFTDDPDLHLVADGAVTRAQAVAEDVYRFTVPAGARALAIASCSAVPAEVELSAQDRRRLGVPLRRIVLYEDDLRIEIGPGYAGLSEGFHENEGAHRWTDGMARLPEALLALFTGELTVELHVTRAGLRYPTAAATAKSRRRAAQPEAEPAGVRPRRRRPHPTASRPWRRQP